MTTIHGRVSAFVLATLAGGLLGFESAAVAGEVVPPLITVSGKIQYTGRSGAEGAAGSNTLFPSRGVHVVLYDRNVTSTDVMLAETWTDDAGNYSFAGVNPVETSGLPEDTAGIFDPYIKVLPESRPVLPAAGGLKSAINVRRPGALTANREPTPGTIYDRNTVELVNPMGDVTINHNFGTADDTDRSFSVYDAFTTITRYHSALPASTNNAISATYPSPMSTSNFSDGLMHLIAGDQYDWDVTAHEYGHYVQARYNLANSPGGNHSLDRNLRFSRAAGGLDGGTPLNRRHADRLAWGEGWATYFGTSGQEVMNAAALGIQRAGDSIYHDNSDADGITLGTRYQIESRAGSPSRGEDHEAAVARILYDLYDANNEAADRDRVTLGHAAVYNLVKNNATHSLSDFWTALTAGVSNQTKVDYGAIFQAHNVSAAPDIASINNTIFYNDQVAPQTFAWAKPVGGQSGAFNNELMSDYKVLIFDSSFNQVCDSGWLGDVTIWFPDDGTWTTLMTAQYGQMYWVVVDRDATTENRDALDAVTPATFAYVTGDYWSDSLPFTILPTPSSLALLGVGALAFGRRRTR